MNCRKCNNEINPLRLKALPETKVCVNCSDTSRWYVRNVISGKTTYAETEVIKDPEAARTIAATGAPTTFIAGNTFRAVTIGNNAGFRGLVCCGFLFCSSIVCIIFFRCLVVFMLNLCFWLTFSADLHAFFDKVEQRKLKNQQEDMLGAMSNMVIVLKKPESEQPSRGSGVTDLPLQEMNASSR